MSSFLGVACCMQGKYGNVLTGTECTVTCRHLGHLFDNPLNRNLDTRLTGSGSRIGVGTSVDQRFLPAEVGTWVKQCADSSFYPS